tara:strand:- start:213 stop:428 length:216 start_codon:yes stop_codon:yes gene_type:complete
MTQSYLETTFNVPLTGEQISSINFFRSYWKINNPSYFDITSSDYDQDYVDEWEIVENILKNTSKIYERNFK